MTKKTGNGIRVLGACLFVLYLIALYYFLFLAENYGHGAGEYDYNLVPFREIGRFIRYRDILGTRALVLNLAGNVIGFMPFGALLPLLMRSARRAWKIGILGLEISLVIELSQFLFQRGIFDVDDLILNTSGALLGYLLFYLVSLSGGRAGGKRSKK